MVPWPHPWLLRELDGLQDVPVHGAPCAAVTGAIRTRQVTASSPPMIPRETHRLRPVDCRSALPVRFDCDIFFPNPANTAGRAPSDSWDIMAGEGHRLVTGCTENSVSHRARRGRSETPVVRRKRGRPPG